jgi:hypothetical protein
MSQREAAKGAGKPAKMVLEDDFYCRARRRRVTYGKCLDDYVDANAFNQKKSACWRCLQGREHRQQYANG